MGNEKGPVDPNRLTAEQAAKLLSAAAKVKVPVAQIEKDIENGAEKCRWNHQPDWLRGMVGEGDGPWRMIGYGLPGLESQSLKERLGTRSKSTVFRVKSVI
ncbi:MAG: hypothetical protein R3C03_23530 [Pirellulaceae bacterium]